tara:strand:- start:253 stop:879 length:627 start_codon:yes stop_codon:yes gene_type:complete
MNIREILEDSRLEIPPVNQSKISQFQVYLDLLVKWNQKINLTSEKTPKEILEQHIFDSLQYAQALSPKDVITDIGSGAGFPGMPLKIIYPDLKITLIESQRKRCSFLEAAILQLGLEGIRVINERAEKILPSGLVEAVIFRAVSDINNCLEIAAPFLKIGGEVILKKNLETKDPENALPDGFSLQKKIIVFGYSNKKSSLMIFEKRLA